MADVPSDLQHKHNVSAAQPICGASERVRRKFVKSGARAFAH
jgi:hypothetical protein